MKTSVAIDDKEKFDDLYTIFVSQGIKIAKKMLGTIEKTPEAIATALIAITTRIEDAGERNGLFFDIPVIFNGARDVMIYIISQAGIEADEAFVKETVGLMVGKYLDQAISSGKMTKEQAQELLAQSQQGQGGGGQQPRGILSRQMGGQPS